MNFSGFHKLSVEERLKKIKEFTKLTDEDVNILKKTGSLDLEKAEMMSENVVGTTELPFSIATNFSINDKDVLVPMCIEEPSVVAAASYAAKLSSGFITESSKQVMRGQIQIVKPQKDEDIVNENKEKIIKKANEQDPVLIKFGGGVQDIKTKTLETEIGKMIIVELLVNVKDAMGANAVNTMAEAVAPLLEKLLKGKARLRIISNLATERLFTAKSVWSKEKLGEKTIQGILEAYHFAKNDIHRCATHNKGIMNGIDAVVIATGNDFRAIEAGAHSFAAMDGYKPLTKYQKDKEGNLVGEIKIPLALGTIGGATRTNPLAKIALKILDVKTAKELGEIIASVGLAQNFAALRALASEGIQKGHMKLHAKNIAATAGASGEEIEKTAEKMIKRGKISVDEAQKILES